MKIVLVTAFFRPHMGGVENYTENVASNLTKMGNEVIVLTSALDGAETMEIKEEGYSVIRLRSSLFLNGRFPWYAKDQDVKDAMWRLLAWKPDAFIINTRFYPLSLLGMSLAQQAGIIPIVIEHGSAYLTVNNKVLDRAVAAYEHAITRMLNKYPARFYGVSQASSDWLRTFGIESEGVLPNAIDTDAFLQQSSCRSFRQELGLSNDDTVVAFVGRLVPEKGVKEILNTAQLFTDNTDISFLLAGDGPLEGQVKSFCCSNVHYLGRLDRPSLARLMIESDILCMPTRSEGFSTALLEAAACATVPVITDVGGVAELVPDSSHGIVLQSRNSEAIYAAIQFLRENPDARNKMAHNIQKRVKKHFSWKTTTESIVCACKSAREKAEE